MDLEMVENRTLSQIANWFAELKEGGGNGEQVLLPHLQRGWVWKPEQVEALWDSMMRGFPISSFVLFPTEETPPRYLLLDGQQRAKAIALGFWNPWSDGDVKKGAKGEGGPEYARPLELPSENALWIDLTPPDKDDPQRRKFIFRLVTKYHPWGFSRKNPFERLTTEKIRQAVELFKKGEKCPKDKPPSKFGLENVWPWEAEAPIPVCFLIEAIRNSNGATDPKSILIEVKKRLNKLPFWGKDCRKRGEKENKTIHEKVEERLDGANDFVNDLIARLRELVIENSNYKVPIILPFNTRKSFLADSPILAQRELRSDDADELEILFERFNRGGTRLEGEELIYSLLKSTFPKVTELVENQEQRLVPPSRYVWLASRLLLAKQASDKVQHSEKESGVEFPSFPNVARFRSLIKEEDKNYKNFRENLMDLIKSKEGQRIFQRAYGLLTENDTENDYGLPPVLAVNIARSSPDLLFLLLFLLWKKRDVDFDDDKRKKLIGTITAITFFGDQKKCAKLLWNGVTKEEFDLDNIFSEAGFRKILSNSEDSGRIMIPLIAPEIFRAAINKGLIEQAENTESEIWKKPEVLQNHIPDNVKQHIEKILGNQDIGQTWREKFVEFVEKLKNEKRLLLFVQRQYLEKWCQDYDPTIPESTEDRNRPWDYDHIFPYNLVSSKKDVPRLIRPYLINSIGNLRAWPLELNRSDSDALPRKKLSEDKGEEETRKLYCVSKRDQLKKASFIGDDDLEYWNKVESDSAKKKEKGIDLVKAITIRLTQIYEDWYKTLGIGEMTR